MIVVNFFAGPGTGKSTHAAMLFAKLKTQNINSELIQEYAKDKTWLRDSKTLEVQPYIAGKQFFRQARLRHDVDVAVTDSPLLMGMAYSGYGITDNFNGWLVDAFKMFSNINIFLVRNTEHHKFNPAGRWQDENAAIEKDKEIKAILDKFNFPYYTIEVNEDSHDRVYETVINDLKFRAPHLFQKEETV